MSTNRFSTLLIVLMLAVVAVLSIRTAIRADSSTYEMDSATRSYIAWGEALRKAADSSTYEMDSATRSYIAWGEALRKANVENIMVPVTSDNPALGAANQSNIAWVKACGADLSYVNNADLNSAARSYIAQAKFVQCGGNEE